MKKLAIALIAGGLMVPVFAATQTEGTAPATGQTQKKAAKRSSKKHHMAKNKKTHKTQTTTAEPKAQ